MVVRHYGWLMRPTLATALMGMLMCRAITAQNTLRVSVDAVGTPGDGDSLYPSLSGNGLIVVFQSYATNLVPGDTNGRRDIFVHNLQTGETERVSVSTSGQEGNDDSGGSAISFDGRYVAFQSRATNLVDDSGGGGLFIRDMLSGTTDRASFYLGTPTSMSADGRYFAFWSLDAVISGDTNHASDAFIYDRTTMATEIVSVDSSGVQGNDDSYEPFVSPDGHYVSFWSYATNLTPEGTAGYGQVYLRDLVLGTTELISRNSSGTPGNDTSVRGNISSDGRYVSFASDGTNLVLADTNNDTDYFVRDRLLGTTEKVSVDSAGLGGNGWSTAFPSSISADGRIVGFFGSSSNLVPGDTNEAVDVFVHDIRSGVTELVSVDAEGGHGNSDSGLCSVSADGRFVAFESWATNLTPGPTGGFGQIYVRDRGPEPSFIILPICFGDGLSVPCPCNNVGAVGHGCDNSSGTGGAVLSGTGEARISADTLILLVSGERTTATSLFWQGDQVVPHRVFGDGIGCMSGHLKRMYVHNAVGGSVASPQNTEPSVSSRSAALGNPIEAGTVRIYHVFYRDPDPGFCAFPTGSTFNVSNGLRVFWGS